MIADKLRKSILQAAIQGKLTEQLVSDGDARDLLVDIQEEKKWLIKEKKIKKEQPLPPISEEKIPFDIPDNWVWVRLGNLFNVCSAKRVHQSDWRSTGVPFYRAREIAELAKNGTVDNDLFIERQFYETLKDHFGVPKVNDLMVTGVGTLGKTYIVGPDDEFYYKDASVLCFNNYGNLNADFFKYLMDTQYMHEQIYSFSSGTTVATLTMAKCNLYLMPLPPLAEQQRIVERLEEILPSIAALEKDESRLDTLQQSFPKKMKDSLLQAAIQGKLTKQLASDGSAQDLLKDIQEEKKRLIKEGKIKKERPLPKIAEDEIPFDIPENWCWVGLGEIGNVVGGGTPKTGNPRNWDDGDIPWITPADMKYQSKYVLCGERCISAYGLNHSSAQLMPKGTVLFSSRAPIGYIGIAANHICTNQGFKSLVPFSMNTNEYLYYAIMAVTKTIEKMASGTTFKEVSGATVKMVSIPLPPLEEQKRIVARLEELLPKCDELGI